MKKILVFLLLLCSLAFGEPKVFCKFGHYQNDNFVMLKIVGVKQSKLITPINPDYLYLDPKYPNIYILRIPSGVTAIPSLEFRVDGETLTTDPIPLPEEQIKTKKEIQYGEL